MIRFLFWQNNKATTIGGGFAVINTENLASIDEIQEHLSAISSYGRPSPCKAFWPF